MTTSLNVHDATVRAMRGRFLDALEGEHPPDWIVRADRRHRMRPGGHGTEARWDALERALGERYELVSHDGVFEYLHVEPGSPRPGSADTSRPTP